jgi:ubiquinone biosynthesis protein COQ9
MIATKSKSARTKKNHPRAEKRAHKSPVLTHLAFITHYGSFDDHAFRALCAHDPLAKTLYPNGTADLLNAFSDHLRTEFTQALATQKINGTTAQIKGALTLWLDLIYPYQKTYALLIRHPSSWRHLTARLKKLWQLCDQIWLKAGDRSADYNFYTKRGLLAGVLLSTTLYFAHNPHLTRQNLHGYAERRVDDVLALGRLISRVKPKR